MHVWMRMSTHESQHVCKPGPCLVRASTARASFTEVCHPTKQLGSSRCMHAA